jgi:hypothetical protein
MIIVVPGRAVYVFLRLYVEIPVVYEDEGFSCSINQPDQLATRIYGAA